MRLRDIDPIAIIAVIFVIGVLAHSFGTPVRMTGARTGAQLVTDTPTKADKIPSPSLDTPVPQADAQKKADTDIQADTEKAVLVKVMKDAVAARHGGVLPKAWSAEDTKVAAQAAVKWQAAKERLVQPSSPLPK